MEPIRSDVTEVVEDVYEIIWERTDEGVALNRGNVMRSYLFDYDDDRPTLVDTCFAAEESVERLTSGIDETGVTPERLVLTHNHPDHAGGFDAIVDRYGVETWVPELDDLAEAEELDAQTPADHLYTDGDRIGRFAAVHIGGHSPGSSVLVDERAGVCVCGDSLSGADRRGLPAGYLIHPPQATNVGQPLEALVDAEENLVRLLDYDFEVALVFHGSSVYEGARDKLEAYVNYEPNYTSDEPSAHRPDRSPLPKDVLRDVFG